MVNLDLCGFVGELFGFMLGGVWLMCIKMWFYFGDLGVVVVL